MMIRTAATAAGAAVLLFSGTAAASSYPIQGASELTHNPLYEHGRLPSVPCKAVKGASKASTTKWITTVVGCLNSAWAKSVKDFSPVRVEVKAKARRGVCLSGMEISGSFANPCYSTIDVQLGPDWIKATSETAVLIEITRAYAKIIQAQTGISSAWWALPSSGIEAEMDEQTYRYFLQSDCLTGVSMKVLGRTAGNWKPLLDAETPEEYDRFDWYGKPANRVHWFEQGYRAGGPKACNTWKAPSSKVS
ncbi:hypothetical protein [Planomonospora sp. ID82291]|uniref:hypothetical protein n=1 Tax=Planomonospora sp. ID82291 TaxID=2738136 RepID=UPI0018C3BFF5|nr:hypothetical protein [Planomonospora sp. ID82291]MBG0816085.1 hypothetical protein [Planomonospora sp. ID82291]